MSTMFALLMAVVAVVSALGVVLSRNPIHSALFLILNLLTVAAIFAGLDAHFLAVTQIIVYAGAIMVLFLFVIMLLNLKVEEPKRRGRIYAFLSWVGGISFAVVIAKVFRGASEGFGAAVAARPAAEPVEGTVAAIGKILFTEFAFTFEVASFLLIAAIVGAVMLAKRRYRTTEFRSSEGA